MALRISRGLFRLWIVLSAFWIAVVAAFTWKVAPTTIETVPSATSTDQNWGEKYKNPPSETISVPNHSTRRDNWSDVTKPLSDADVGISASKDNPFAEFVSNSTVPRETILIAVQLAFIPPMIVLAIGSALGWAFKGFR